MAGRAYPREMIRAFEACSWSCLAVASPAQTEAMANATSNVAKAVRGGMSAAIVCLRPYT